MKKTIAILIVASLILAVAVPCFVIPNAKGDASEAQVLNDDNWYIASSSGLFSTQAGDLVVVGEVQNVGTGIIQNVTLSATALDSNGTALGTATTESTGMVFTYQTLPQGKAPFVIDFPDSASWSSEVATVQVTVLSVIDATSPPYEGLNMVGTPTAFNDSGAYTVVGTIINNGSQTMGYVWAVTTFYDSTGKVVGLNYTSYLATPYAPVANGGPLHYVATPVDNTVALSNEISSFAYVIDSIPYSASEQSNTQSTPTPTASTGSSSGLPWLAIIIIVVAVVIVAVALLLLRKRPETQPLPPPPPPPPENQEQ